MRAEKARWAYDQTAPQLLEMGRGADRNAGTLACLWSGQEGEGFCVKGAQRPLILLLCSPDPSPTHSQITRRYAEFSSAIVSINQTFPHERTLALLGQLQVGLCAGQGRPSLQGEQLVSAAEDPEMVGGMSLTR